ncbi:fatty acid desaturase [Streptomyces sp. WM6378]|uniref:fatty acid desaturase n=1 Tax=Streptomyces sp. WM6378 TaxID=1415557 RepID=UPI0006AEEB59|nr:fatty acid desaturase [Streptomyces sp. WM6378]KOU47571.1 hypothetical protein ADK54_13390 [Streptomyces sp. WM6378]
MEAVNCPSLASSSWPWPAPPPCIGNPIANTVRNLWSHPISFCGHFPEGVRTFTEEHLDGETCGGWYLRQIQGSANNDGGPLFHILSGNLGHQIEHHASTWTRVLRFAVPGP